MISSTKPQAWTLSPQMTAAPELWRDVLGAFPLWSLTEQNLAIPSTKLAIQGSSVTLDPGLSGMSGNNFTNKGYLYVDDAGFCDIASPPGPMELDRDNFRVSVLAALNVGSIDDSFECVLTKGRTVGFPDLTAPFSIVSSSSTSELGWEVNDGSNRSLLPVSKSANEEMTVVGTFDGTNQKVFKNGKEEGSATPSWDGSANTSPNGDRFAIGDDPMRDDIRMNWSGRIYFVVIWRRALTQEEALFLSADPFAMLRPAGF